MEISVKCQCVIESPCKVCEEESARAPQFDWTNGPRMVTSELPRLVSAAFSSATWLNWTEERQPMKPLEAACITSSLKFSSPADTQRIDKNICWYLGYHVWSLLQDITYGYSNACVFEYFAEWNGRTYWWLCPMSRFWLRSALHQMTACTFCGYPGRSGWVERNQITSRLQEIRTEVTASAAHFSTL